MPSVPPSTNTKALISLISGIVGWVLNLLIISFFAIFGSVFTIATLGFGTVCLTLFVPLYCIPPIGWLVAVITGNIALNEIRTRSQGGRGMAIAGLVMGYLGLGLIVLLILAAVLLTLLGASSIPVLEELLRQLQLNP